MICIREQVKSITLFFSYNSTYLGQHKRKNLWGFLIVVSLSSLTHTEVQRLSLKEGTSGLFLPAMTTAQCLCSPNILYVTTGPLTFPCLWSCFVPQSSLLGPRHKNFIHSKTVQNWVSDNTCGVSTIMINRFFGKNPSSIFGVNAVLKGGRGRAAAAMPQKWWPNARSSS